MSVPGRFTSRLINCQTETSTFNTEMFFFSVLISCSGDQGSDLSEEPIAGFVAKAKLTG
jgi:hypothetical protein